MVCVRAASPSTSVEGFFKACARVKCHFAEPNWGKGRKLRRRLTFIARRPLGEAYAEVMGEAKWPFHIRANLRPPIASGRRFLFTTYC